MEPSTETPQAPASSSGHAPGTLGDVLLRLDAGCLKGTEHLVWPPDVFCLAAYALKLSGGYTHVLQEWPPQGSPGRGLRGGKWVDWSQELGRQWRHTAAGLLPAPQQVEELWRAVASRGSTDVRHLRQDREACCALLELMAVADEASAGVGIPFGQAGDDPFLARASTLLLAARGTSLSPRVHRGYARVLPKQHTPRGGLTLRSLTHHLALHVGAEVTPFWYTVPIPQKRNINLLVAPWPLEIVPSQFQPVPGALHEMPERFRFVEYHPRQQSQQVAAWTRQIMEEALRIAGRVDGVVFPELALSQDEYEAVREVVLERGAFLIAGVLAPAAASGVKRNLVVFDARVDSGPPVHVEQVKHHRWRLDRPQVEMYGLGGNLDPSQDWWEHVAVGDREVHFIALDKGFSLCCLVCEDLARQDPVAELVRGVGPNLIIALLMDAPQLGVRWPARYAAVLADDPGTSVLTVTSAGMVDLTRPPRGARPSRSVALWKDARSELMEVELPAGASAVLLSLCSEAVEEWTADGRSDHGAAGYPRLGGIHMIRGDSPRHARSRKGRLR